MKKFVYSLLLMTFAALTATVMVACGDDDIDPSDDNKTQTQKMAKSIVTVGEDFFKYGEATVSVEYEGTTLSFQLNEGTKTTDPEVSKIIRKEEKAACRTIDTKAMNYKTRPIRTTLNLILTEEGKKLMAENPEDKVDMCILFKMGDCDKNGKFFEDMPEVSEIQNTNGVRLKNLESYIETAKSHNMLTKTLK